MSYCDFTLNFLKVVIVLVLFFTSSALAGHPWNKSGKRILPDEHVPLAPQFDDLSIQAVQANIGQTVLLPCTVHYLGDKVVSWIRSKDLHILTTSTLTFSADTRFESVHSIENDFWGLRISGVKISDSGRYECQVNSDPKMSLGITLSVTEVMQNTAALGLKWSSFANIKGPPEVYVKKGNAITFTCEITTSSSFLKPPPPPYPPIYWLHDGNPISFDSHKQAISMETDYRNRHRISRLRIGEASQKYAGVYTCTQVSAKPHSVALFVVETEHSEAMQRDAPHSSSRRKHINLVLVYVHNLLFLKLMYFVFSYKF